VSPNATLEGLACCQLYVEVPVRLGNRSDIAERDPVLELEFGPCSLQCAGTLDSRTRHTVLEAVEVVLLGNPPNIAVDVSGLRVADADGANSLVILQRMIRDAGVNLQWRGLDTLRLSEGIAV
jgi:hypothetical protein